MNRLATLLLVLIVAVLAGCIPDPLEVSDIPTLPPKLVISSQVIPGEGIGILVTRSIDALEAGWGSELEPLMTSIAVEDALVILEYDGQRDTLTHQAYGVYHGGKDIVAGKTYILQVTSPTLGEVRATAVALRQVLFENASAELYKTGFDSLASVTYSLVDPPEQNWYMVNVQMVSATNEIDRYLNPRVFTRLIRDDAFNGQEFKDQFNVVFQNYSLGDSVLVTMSNISEEYFHYLALRNDSRYSLAGFASEPLNLPTNVQGGYGYFNLHIPDVRVFVLE